jgi:predicted transglutaminase-like cysteine proteinase
MLLRVAAGCLAAFLIVWPVRSGLDSGTLDAFSPAAAELVPAHNQDDETLTQMAAFDPAEPAAVPGAAEPFGLVAAPVTSGGVVTKWSSVEADLQAGNEILARCRADTAHCPAAAKNFLDIVAEASPLTGRTRIGTINRAVNMAIEPMSDMAQWGVPDRWSAPLETLATGRGDCEDYAIAKYAALTAAGVAAEDVKLVVVRNLAVNEDHAVVAVRDAGNWIVLDNRWLKLVQDVDMPKVVPLFVLDDNGVRRFEPAVSAVRQTAAPASF